MSGCSLTRLDGRPSTAKFWNFWKKVMPLCHCFSHSLVFTFASADPTHDIKQYFTERKPIVSRSAYDQAVDRFRKNGSFGHVRADLFGAKDASQKGRRRCKKPGPKRKWTKLFEKEVRKEACSTYAFKTEQQLAGIHRCSKAHIHRTLTGRAVEAGEKSCTVRKTESHTVEKNMPRIIEMGHSCYEVPLYRRKNRQSISETIP